MVAHRPFSLDRAGDRKDPDQCPVPKAGLLGLAVSTLGRNWGQPPISSARIDGWCSREIGGCPELRS